MSSVRQSSKTAKPKKVKRVQTPKKRAIPKLDASMNVMEIAALHPDAVGVLEAYGLHCTQCAFNTLDSLEAGARTHGLNDDDLQNMLSDIRELLAKTPSRTPTLTLSESAARGLKNIAVAEGKTTVLLKVTTDDHGGFCMEFADHAGKNDARFSHPSVPDVSLIASAETLGRIGGATVDFRDGRFKLDIPNNEACGCTENAGCHCAKEKEGR